MRKFFKIIMILILNMLTLLALLIAMGIGNYFYKTYKNRNEFSHRSVQDCIQEEQCFKFAFERYTGLGKPFAKPVVKWNGPIGYNISFSGCIEAPQTNKNKQSIKFPVSRNIVLQNFAKIALVFPYDLNENIATNYMITITGNLEDNKNSIFRDNILKVFPASIWKKHESTLSKEDTYQRSNVIIQNQIRGTLLLLKDDYITPDPYVALYIMSTLGFPESDKLEGAFKFDLLSNGELNELQLLLIKALYDERLKPGMYSSEVRGIFPKIYANILADYKISPGYPSK